MPAAGWGFLLLLFPWARNFTPIVSATQLLNQDIFYTTQGTAEEQPLTDIVISDEKNFKKNLMK